MLKNGIYYIENTEDILYLQQHPEQPFFVNLMNDRLSAERYPRRK